MASLQLARSASRAAFVPVRRHQAEGEKKPSFCDDNDHAVWAGSVIWLARACRSGTKFHTHARVLWDTQPSGIAQEIAGCRESCFQKSKNEQLLLEETSRVTVKLYINTLAGSNKTSSESLKEDPSISS